MRNISALHLSFYARKIASRVTHLFSNDGLDLLLEDVSLELGVIVHLLLDPVRLNSMENQVEGTLLHQLLAFLDSQLMHGILEKKDI